MSRRTLRAILLFTLAAGLRLAFLPLSGRWAAAVDDQGFEEVRLGRSLAAGCGFCSPFWRLGEHASYPSAHSPPGFPVVLATIIRAEEPFGVDPATPVRTAAVLGGLVGALAVLLLALVGRRAAGEFGFWSVGIIAAIWPTLVRESVFPWDTAYVMLAIAVGFWLCTSSPPAAPTRRQLITLGVVIGLFGLFNPIVAPFLGFATASWFIAGMGLRRATAPVLAVGLIAFACVTPWLIRNSLTFHRFIPVRNNFGLELWIGNHPGSDGTTLSAMTWHPSNSVTERQLVAIMGDDAYMQWKSKAAVEEIRANREGFLALTLRRVQLFWMGNPNRPTNVLGRALPMVGGVNLVKVALNSLMLALALFGLTAWRSTPARWLAGFGLLVLPLPFYVTHVSPNYRSIVDPILCLLAGVGVAMAWHWWRGTAPPLGTPS